MKRSIRHRIIQRPIFGGGGRRGPPPDTAAPSTPGEFIASAITATGCTLTWDPSTDNVGVVEYEVQQRLASGVNGDYVTVATIAAPTVTAAITGLVTDTGYRFRVRAKDAAGNASAWGPDDDGLAVQTLEIFKIETSATGTVHAVLPLPDGGYIIGGNFTSVIEPVNTTGSAYLVDVATDTAILGAFTDGAVYACVALPDGGYILGGKFTRVRNASRQNIARINADGTLHAWNPGASSTVPFLVAFVYALAISGTDVIVGGQFTTLGGASRSNIGSVPLASNTATTWDPGASSIVYALAISGTNVIVGGSFSTLGGASRSRIGAVPLASNTATTWNPGASRTNSSSNVNALVISGTNVIVGGQFTTLGGASRSYIGSVPLASNTATAWNPGVSGPSSTVRALAISGTDVIVGGSFSTLGGASRSYIGSVPLASNTATTWDPGASGTVWALAISGTDVIVGGVFTTLGGESRSGIGSVPLASNTATTWNPGASGPSSTVYALTISGTDVIVGGGFAGTKTTNRSRIARVNNDGTLHAWDPGAGSIVLALAISGTDVIVGGQFTTLGGASRSYIGSVPLASNAATTWNPGASAVVNALAISGTNVIVGGQFTTLGGASRSRIGAVPLASNTATTWNPGAFGTVNALVISGSDVIVGGSFTTLGGESRSRIGSVPLASNTATTWNPGAGSIVLALAISGTDVIVGGQFTTLGGASRSYIGSVPLASNAATTWNPGASAVLSAFVHALAIRGTDVIVGGQFTTLGGASRQRIGSVPLASNDATTWDPGAGNVTGPIVHALAISGTDVIAGGYFEGSTTGTPMPFFPFINSGRIPYP